jgi:hypothetical protein
MKGGWVEGEKLLRLEVKKIEGFDTLCVNNVSQII